MHPDKLSIMLECKQTKHQQTNLKHDCTVIATGVALTSDQS